MRQFVLMSLVFAAIGGGLSLYLEGPTEVVVLFGLVMTMLIAAVLQKEHELIHAIGEHTQAIEEYDAMIGRLPIGLFAVQRGEVVFANDAWTNTHGPELKDFFNRIHALDRDPFIKSLERAEDEDQPFVMTLRAYSLNGMIDYEVYGSPLRDRDGTLKHVLVFCVDVSLIVKAKNEVARKHREVDEKNFQLNAALRQVERSLESMVEAMVRAVEIKDPYTAGHSSRVRQYSEWIGERLGLSKYEMRVLSYGALIHDVGKIGVPDHILRKPALLTPAEYDTVKLHTVYGANIVGDIDLFCDYVPIVRWHHERLDGSGYPDGLTGEEIPYLANIVAVADVFDAMTSTRSYRQSISPENAMEIMAQEVAEGRLDPTAFEALRSAVAERGMIGQSDSQRAA